jgi:hypothetical protein
MPAISAVRQRAGSSPGGRDRGEAGGSGGGALRGCGNSGIGAVGAVRRRGGSSRAGQRHSWTSQRPRRNRRQRRHGSAAAVKDPGPRSSGVGQRELTAGETRFADDDDTRSVGHAVARYLERALVRGGRVRSLFGLARRPGGGVDRGPVIDARQPRHERVRTRRSPWRNQMLSNALVPVPAMNASICAVSRTAAWRWRSAASACWIASTDSGQGIARAAIRSLRPLVSRAAYTNSVAACGRYKYSPRVAGCGPLSRSMRS